MFVFEALLKRCLKVFPAFTDHTLLHTLNVINISNQILRLEAEKLSAEEIYIYLMSAALHDVGMGVNDKDFESFIDSINRREYVEAHKEITRPTFIRMFHNELSAEFVMKYSELLEIPNNRYAHAIALVSKGHRKVDLFDESEYPTDYDLGDGRSANLAALGAILRIADELDIGSDRNLELLYDINKIEGANESNFFEFAKHEAIEPLNYEDEYILANATTEEKDIEKGILEEMDTVKSTMDYAERVLAERSDIRLYTTGLRLNLNGREYIF